MLDSQAVRTNNCFALQELSKEVVFIVGNMHLTHNKLHSNTWSIKNLQHQENNKQVANP